MLRYYCPDCLDLYELEEENDGLFVCPMCYGKFTTEEAKWIEDNNDTDDVPSGCAACGGPYPYCKTSCKLFDD